MCIRDRYQRRVHGESLLTPKPIIPITYRSPVPVRKPTMKTHFTLETDSLDLAVDAGSRPKLTTLKNSYLRWIVLALGCIILFAQYFTFDIPMPMQAALQTEMGISDFEYSLLFTVPSLPNMILPFFGGFLVDAFGLRASLYSFISILMIGQSIVTAACFSLNFKWLLIGRFIYGVASECVHVAVYSVIASWFLGRELAVALAIKISFGRFGSSFNSGITPILAESSGNIGYPFLVGLVFLVVAFFSAIFFLRFDDKNKDHERRMKNLTASAEIISSAKPVIIHHNPCLHQETGDDRERIALRGSERKETINLFAGIRTYKPIFWWLVAVCLIVYAALKPFLIIANKFLMVRFGYSSVGAGFIVMIPLLISMILGPFVGWVVDRFGKRVSMMFASFFLLVISHSMLAFLPNYENGNSIVVLPMVLFGVFYTVFCAAIWPAFPLVIDIKYVSRAFGLVASLVFVVFGTMPMLAGVIHDSTEDDYRHGYFWVEILMLGLSVLGMILTAGLYVVDRRSGSVLERRHATTHVH
eukprot:TRINITY_DN26998_c0_g1_i1.p1 TRINITY_DN26998_c0_g1~~TRINITY_DN26998_c0_g1_i1.p1  ORF type:complete len:560 (-),score=183.62 TRINITY_DN26998_c0_g1_i1:466-2052(-)